MVYRGDGKRQNGEALNDPSVIQTVAGSGGIGSAGDGGSAVEAELSYPQGIALGPDGSLYIADQTGSVRRVAPDGIITTFAGQSDNYGFAGDGGPATAALLGWNLVDLAFGPDGSLYILDNTLNNQRIRKVDPQGIISTVAGIGTNCSFGEFLDNKCGDGGPATAAEFGDCEGIGVGPDGSIFLAESSNNRVRKISPDGIITTVVGIMGNPDFTGDDGPAVTAGLANPRDVAVGRDGSLYIADTGHYAVRKVGVDGMIFTIAGIPNSRGYSGEGLPATQSKLYYPGKLFVDSNDILYIHDGVDNFPGRFPRIRRVWPAGVMDTVAGNGTIGFSGDLGPAIQARLNSYGYGGVALGPDGSLYIADEVNVRVRRVSPVMPGSGLSETRNIPSRDGAEIYQFDRYGRHIRTLQGLTGAVLLTFTYDGNGLLTRITDADGKMTNIERGTGGWPTAIVGPYGRRTTLQPDPNKFVASITNPAGDTPQFTYSDTGLLNQMLDGRGNIHSFFYDSAGRLIRDENPAGGFLTLDRTDQEQGYTVKAKTALNRETIYQTEYLSTGQKMATQTFPTGGRTESVTGPDGSETITLPDGMTLQTVPGPDPRFGMMAPIEKSITSRTPAGLTFTQTLTRSATLTNPYDPLTITGQIDDFTLNGKTYRYALDLLAGRLTRSTPLNRSMVIEFDNQGRLLSYQPAGLEAFAASYDYGRLIQYGQGNMNFSLAYNPAGEVASRTNAAGETIAYGYDDAGRVTEITTPLGHSHTFDYDGQGNPTGLTMPNGKIHGFSYNPQNLLSEYTPPESLFSYSFTHNTESDLTRMELPGGRAVNFTFDAGERLSEIQYPEAAVQLRYTDLTDRFFQVERIPATGPSQQIEYAHDGALRTAAIFSGTAIGAYNYTYDSDYSLAGINFTSGSDSVSVPLIRDGDGLLTKYGNLSLSRDATTGRTSRIADDGSGIHTVQVDYTYDPLGRFSGRSVTVKGIPVYSFQLTRNAAGRIIQKENGAVYTYTYDADGRLTEVWEGAGKTEAYGYDPNSNRTGTLTATALYDAQDRITNQGGTVYQHNDDGFLTNRGTDSFTYSARGELIQATAGGTTIDYAYDGFGRRVGRKVDSGNWQQYFYGNPYDFFLLTATRDANGVLTTYFYDDFTHLVAFQRGTDWYYVAADQVGTPVSVSDKDGSIVKALTYDSFGVLTSDNAPEFELSIGFAGGIHDPETGLVRFGSRDYDPVIGRWTARDPVLFAGRQLNLYAYAFNNPVSLRDPSGTTDEDGLGIFEALNALFEGRSPGGPYDQQQQEYEWNDRWKKDWKEKGDEKCLLTQRKMKNPLLVDLALGINDLVTKSPKVAYELLKGMGLIKTQKPPNAEGPYVVTGGGFNPLTGKGP
jgi:RHS repeat-associated protein